MKRALRYEGRIHKDLKQLDADTQARILSALERFAATGDGDVVRCEENLPVRIAFGWASGECTCSSRGRRSSHIKSTTEAKPTDRGTASISHSPLWSSRSGRFRTQIPLT